LQLKDGRKKCGGNFDNEHEAAKQVNQLCEEIKLSAKNLGLTATNLESTGGMPNEQVPVNKVSLHNTYVFLFINIYLSK
jgi:hypothetical protein